MKKIIFLLIIGILFLSSFNAIALKNNIIINDSITNVFTLANSKNEVYTHIVFLEIGNTQFCGGCDFWNSDVYELYSTGNYEFEYVNMIVYGPYGWDDILNQNAYDWNNFYNITKYPTSILDGDYRRLSYQPYTLLIYIDECGNRAVKDIIANMTLQWLGNATIKVDIAIKNNKDESYNGYIRAAISEITSRYSTVNNSRFHFGFLDYAFNKNISISTYGIYTDSIIWNGNEHEDNHGNNFGDISPGNIQVVMGVFNCLNGFVDETVKAFVNNPPDAPTIEGPKSGKPGEEYEFKFVSVDPKDNDVFYYIKWGDETFEDWFGPYNSGEKVNISHNWSTKGIYNIKARAKTINGLIGPWGEYEIEIPRNRISIDNNCLLRFLEKFPILGVFLRIMVL